MTAYFVAVRNGISDPGAMVTYRELAAKAREGHPMVPLAAYGKIRPTDGLPADGGVILAFPTFAEAEAWYYSEAYQEALQYRLKGGEYQTFILEGLD